MSLSDPRGRSDAPGGPTSAATRGVRGTAGIRGAFTAGVSAALSGMRLSSRSAELRRTYFQLVLALLVTATMLDVVGIWSVLHFTPIGADASWWEVALVWVIRVIGIVVVLLAAPLVGLALVNLAFPFLGERVFLAAMRVVSPARAEQLAAQPGLPLATALGVAVLRLAMFVALGLGAFVLSLVPVVGQVLGPVLQGYLGARGLAWELLDPYLDKLGLGFSAQRAFVADHRPALVGFGLPLTLLMAIPVAGPLMFGLAQGAAAQLVVEVIEAPIPRAATV
jgi:CysZ protein